jgi:hypothetical protein
MKIGDLVRRNPEAWEFFSKRELSEFGLVISIEEDKSTKYTVVLWAVTGISWDEPTDLLSV